MTPKAMDILEVFVGRPGELITRDEIIGKVWGPKFVEDGNLSVHISKLRKALGESRADRRLFETVPGSGYRFTSFVCDIRPSDNAFAAIGRGFRALAVGA